MENNIKEGQAWLLSLPQLTDGFQVSEGGKDSQAIVAVLDNAESLERDGYLKRLSEKGFSIISEYSLGGNEYALLNGYRATVYLSYLRAAKKLKIYAEPKGVTKYPSSEPCGYEAIKDYEPTLWQMNVDSKCALSYMKDLPKGRQGANGGMCYIMRVADGSFVIIDSGYHTKKQATDIFELLKENSPEECPVISAWIFTHVDGDHIMGFQTFTDMYADWVKIKGFYLNFPESSWEKIREAIEKYPDAVVYRGLQAGMRFYIADARFDVIYSYCDRYFSGVELSPEKCKKPLCRVGSDTNNDSLVFRVTLGGQRIMFLGDVEMEGSKIIEKNIDICELRSDIVQYSHHGWDGAEASLYDKIAAPTVLWPINVYSWQHNCYGENIFNRLISRRTDKYCYYSVNYYIAHEAEYVKKVIIHGEGTANLILPYTPRSNRLPDHNTIFDRIAKAHEI